MAAANLVPINRALLKRFYADYPLEPVPLAEQTELLQQLAAVQSQSALNLPNKEAAAAVGIPQPSRIDDCLWRSRMWAEEIAHSLGQVATRYSGPAERARLETCANLCQDAAATILETQESNTAAAAAQIKNFLPKDFRASLLEMKRSAQEARNKKSVEDLIKQGGSIRDRYELYLRQQWERREALVQMGNLSGMFKIMVKYLGGIPQVLLDFAKEINAPLGPMEEQRLKYGPDLYLCCELGNALNIAVAAWALARDTPTDTPEAMQLLEVVERCCQFYCHHVTRVICFLGNLFTKSPFFITADAAQQAAEAGSPTARSGIIKDEKALIQQQLGAEQDASPEDAVHCADALLSVVGLHSHHSHTSQSGLGKRSPSHSTRTSASNFKIGHLSVSSDGKHGASGTAQSAATRGQVPSCFQQVQLGAGGGNGRLGTGDGGLEADGERHTHQSYLLRMGNSEDFNSCCDNMSWLSGGAHYQMAVDEDGQLSNRPSVTSPDSLHVTHVVPNMHVASLRAGSMPTIASEGGVVPAGDGGEGHKQLPVPPVGLDTKASQETRPTPFSPIAGVDARSSAATKHMGRASIETGLVSFTGSNATNIFGGSGAATVGESVRQYSALPTSVGEERMSLGSHRPSAQRKAGDKAQGGFPWCRCFSA